MTSVYEVWAFYLPATLVTFVLYLLWLVFGQDSVLPVDLRTTLKGKRTVGDGRGLWGLPAAFLVGVFCAVLQERGIDAVLLALGAEFGCLANSFCKRRLGLARGEAVAPFDHFDFVLGGSLFYGLQYTLASGVLLKGLFICGCAHFAASRLIRGFLKDVEPG